MRHAAALPGMPGMMGVVLQPGGPSLSEETGSACLSQNVLISGSFPLNPEHCFLVIKAILMSEATVLYSSLSGFCDILGPGQS